MLSECAYMGLRGNTMQAKQFETWHLLWCMVYVVFLFIDLPGHQDGILT